MGTEPHVSIDYIIEVLRLDLMVQQSANVSMLDPGECACQTHFLSPFETNPTFSRESDTGRKRLILPCPCVDMC